MSLSKKAIRGTFFVAVNSYLSLFIYFLAGVALARRLPPADFGLFRISLFYVDLFGRLREFGLDKALIHKQEDLKTAYRTHFVLQALLSVLALLCVVAFSPWLKGYSPSVFFFTLILSVAVIFQALGSTQRIFLEKNLFFKKTALIDIISLLISSALSVYLALIGWGALSLVAGYASNLLLSAVLLWIFGSWRPKFSELFHLSASEIKWFFKFGFFLFVGGITTFILYKYNDFILGTFLSITALGFYSRAFNYAQIPTSLVTGVISKVALPTYSVLQKDKEKLSEAFTIVLKSIVRISFPFSLMLFLVAEDMILFLLGSTWLPMVPIFRILLIYGVLRSIFDDLGELFTAVGKPKFVSFYLILQAVLSLILAPVLTRFYGSEGAALSLSIVLAVGVGVAYFLLRRVIRLSSLSIFLPTSLVTVLTAVSFALVTPYLRLGSVAPLFSLLSKLGILGIFYLLFLSILDGKSLLKDLRYLVSKVKATSPKDQSDEFELRMNEGERTEHDI